MNLYFRLLVAYFQARFSPSKSTGFILNRRFRVLPSDIDLYGHMNNGKYLQVMDVARLAWLERVGALRVLYANGWTALLGGSQMRFRRALHMFKAYTVSTQLIYWDDRWYYLEHCFRDASGKLAAKGIVRAAFRNRQGWVSTRKAMALIDPEANCPPMPDTVRAWLEADAALSEIKADNLAQSRNKTAYQQSQEPVEINTPIREAISDA